MRSLLVASLLVMGVIAIRRKEVAGFNVVGVSMGTADNYQQPETAGGSIAEMYSEIRGLRNNNPGNIRHGAKWQGLAKGHDPSFATFKSPEYGIRAMAKVLLNYQKLYGINTVAGLIDRWAPPVENDTGSYINAVARSVGVGANQPIVVADHLLPLVKAIVHHENGIQPYSDALINDGLALV